MVKRLTQIALWVVVVLVIIHGLQACGSRPKSQSKFDQPKYDIHHRHKR